MTIPARRSEAKIVTPYVLLVRSHRDPASSWSEVRDDHGEPVTVYSRGSEQCVRDALKLLPDLAVQAQADDGIQVLAVPARSFKPLPVRVVAQEPIIKIG